MSQLLNALATLHRAQTLFPGLTKTGGCELLCGCWELNSCSPEEHQVALTSEPLYQLHYESFEQHFVQHSSLLRKLKVILFDG